MRAASPRVAASLLLSSVLLAGVARGAAPVTVSGFVESVWAGSDRAGGGRITGNLYLPQRNQFALDAAAVQVRRATPTEAPGPGFFVEAMAGEHAGVVRAAGLDLGSHADVVQAYGTFWLPATGLVVSAGKMATMLGNEVIESAANPNLSVGSQYVFIENFTDTGVDVAWTGGPGWSARARLVNGWDVVADNNRSQTVFARLGWSTTRGSVALLGYSGREPPDSIGGRRSGAEMLASTTIGEVAATLQLDAGREEALDAEWRAAGLWLRIPVSARSELALRADALDDEDGARTSGALGFPVHDGQRLMSLTATLALRPAAGVLVRPELRWDRSDLAVFQGGKQQLTWAVGATFTF